MWASYETSSYFGVLNLDVQWVSASDSEYNKKNNTMLQPPCLGLPFGSCWPLPTPKRSKVASLILLTMMLSTNLSRCGLLLISPPLPRPLSCDPPASLSVCSFTLSCHHSHLNPARRGPDREDWFPVRWCLDAFWCFLDTFILLYCIVIPRVDRVCSFGFAIDEHTQTHTQNP